jgi:hypothetical protein
MRFLAYQDLLATYATDLDPVTRPESNRKAKIVKRTIRTERIRRMFRNIKLTIQRGPISQYGISQIKVPKIPVVPDASLPGPDQFQSYISNANQNDIVVMGLSTTRYLSPVSLPQPKTFSLVSFLWNGMGRTKFCENF